MQKFTSPIMNTWIFIFLTCCSINSSKTDRKYDFLQYLFSIHKIAKPINQSWFIGDIRYFLLVLAWKMIPLQMQRLVEILRIDYFKMSKKKMFILMPARGLLSLLQLEIFGFQHSLFGFNISLFTFNPSLIFFFVFLLLVALHQSF